MIGRTAGNMGLSRLYCRRCCEETLHQAGGVCCHCGELYVVAIPPNKVSRIAQQMIDMHARRARTRARAKARL